MSEAVQIPGEDPKPEGDSPVKVPGGAKKATPKPKASDPGLPDADSIDRTKIGRAVLSSSGWVLPIKPEKA